ncbi:uncharacterized protein TrAFT101_002281 [Trichoderma asperellum]|uniref:CorA-like Mg2+ transporter protein n=2 Tax=Trichoderma asperellum TaxID=101201 RepID=A0A2T3ZG18_TRIA4|nr:hypothetical protein M441DRAFT_190006 [Trichoderma asperellum CBS 433.97]PTB43729.1 hypothetical protein M441DRAFT_190006 [Trichoderma asperellum CBS 433.97]UKZ86450.1 hypothetical protein TrAFT101_002281 [Trichoderma asperellum]
MNEPVVINYNELEAALREREQWQGVWPAVRVIDFHDGKITTDRVFELDVDLESFLKEKPQAKLRFILLETRQVTPNNKDTWQGEVISAAINPAMLRCLRKHAGLFNTFIEATCGIGHWYSAKHMCYNDDFKETVYEKKLDIFYEYIPQEKKHSCTQLSIANNSTTYFFLDLPGSVLARFMGDVARDSKLSTRFFYMDTLIADEAMRTWQKNIALKRTELKSLDKTIDDSKVNNQSLRELHALAREWHILARNLSDYSALLKFFKTSSSRYYALTDSHASKWALDIMSLNGTLEYLDSSCQSLTYLISDYSGRTKTRIDLLYHLASQSESQSARELAELARQDSAAMLTIAAVTLLFLPGTFIASILSTTIFNFADGEMQVYRKWWIFPVTVVPFTILVFVAWFAWLAQKRGKRDYK